MLDRLSLFDVFAAPWFAAVYLLLFVSLVGCLGPRIRLHARALRTPPPPGPRVLSRLPETDRWQTAAEPEQVLDAAATRLRGWQRLSRTADGLPPAERGYLRETGNLLFHAAWWCCWSASRWAGCSASRAPCWSRRATASPTRSARRLQARPPVRRLAAGAVPLRARRLPGDLRRRRQGAHLPRRPALRRRPTTARERPYDLRVNHPLTVAGPDLPARPRLRAEVRVTEREGNGATDRGPFLPQGATFLSSCTIKVPDAAGDSWPSTALHSFAAPARTGRRRCRPRPETPALTIRLPRRSRRRRRPDVGLQIDQQQVAIGARKRSPPRSRSPEPELPGGSRSPTSTTAVGDLPGHPGPGQEARAGRGRRWSSGSPVAACAAAGSSSGSRRRPAPIGNCGQLGACG